MLREELHEVFQAKRSADDADFICIRELTGGMYLGTEKVIGHPAEFILSYPGFGDTVTDKETNEVVDLAEPEKLVNAINNINTGKAKFTG